MNRAKRSHSFFADEAAKDDIALVLGNGVKVIDFLDHLDVKLPLPLRKLGLQHHEEVSAILVLIGGALRKGRHFS